MAAYTTGNGPRHPRPRALPPCGADTTDTAGVGIVRGRPQMGLDFGGSGVLRRQHDRDIGVTACGQDRRGDRGRAVVELQEVHRTG